MANRNTINFREVTQVVADQSGNIDLQGVLDIGSEIMRQNQEAAINENLSKVQLDLNSLQSKYQTDFEADPSSGIKEYKKQRQSMFDAYGENISPFFRKTWNDNVRKIAQQNDLTQQAWAIKQTKVNTVGAINRSMKNNFLQANIDGQNFAGSNDTEISAYLNFENSKRGLIEWGTKNLGQKTTEDMLQNYENDYLKSFISGVADKNPQKAAKLIEDKAIKARFSSDEIDTFENVIRKNVKRKQLGTLFEEINNEDQAADIVSSPDGDYYTKRLQIDTLEMQGKISTSTAEKSRRVLTSQKNVDNLTNSDTMADIVNQMYDLNAVADTNSEDYLIGVRNVRDRILSEQASGKLKPDDAKKLNSQLRTLTSQKTSQATQNAAMGFYDSNQKFTALPPEYRGAATRELFYRAQGKDFTPQQYDAEANKIIDNIKSGIRSETVKRLNNINTPDDSYLKTLGYTMDDVRETAKIYGLTEQQVIQRLKAK